MTSFGYVVLVMPSGLLAFGGSVAGDAPAAAGMARESAQALMTMRR